MNLFGNVNTMYVHIVAVEEHKPDKNNNSNIISSYQVYR